MQNTHNDFTSQPFIDEPQTNLRDYLNIVLRRWQVVFLIFISVFLTATYYIYKQVPTYEAFTMLQIRGTSSFLDGFNLGTKNSLASDIEILKSRSIAEKVARNLRLDLRVTNASPNLKFKILGFSLALKNSSCNVILTGSDSYEVKDSDGKILGKGKAGTLMHGQNITLMLDKLEGKTGDSFTISSVPLHLAGYSLQKNIHVGEIGNGAGILGLTFSDTDPVKARDVVNAFAQAYREQSVDLKTQEVAKTLTFIEKQMQIRQDSLENSEEALRKYRLESGLRILGPEAGVLVEKIVELERQKASVVLQKKRLGFAIDSLNEAMANGKTYLPTNLSNQSIVDAASEITNLQMQKRMLLVDFTEFHPAVQELEEQTNDLYGKIRTSFDSALHDLKWQKKELVGLISKHEEELTALSRSELQLARLTRINRINEEAYTFLLQKYEDAYIAKSASVSNVNIIDPAIIPAMPVKPDKKKDLITWFLIAVLLGVGFAFFLNYMDDTIKDVEGVKRETGLSTLAVIPHIRQKEKNDQQIKGALVSYFKPQSQTAEAFRSLRTAIHFSAINKKRQVMLLTSAFPEEGKTTIAANLAVTIAQTDAKVLLIDCDLRYPGLHRMFGCNNTPGLTEVLIGDTEPDKAVHNTEITGFDFIPSGTPPPNPSEILGSEHMRRMLGTVKDRYDHIILDTAPALFVTDALVLSAVTDMFLVIMEVGRVQFKTARRFIETLDTVRAPIAGVILNDKTKKGYGNYGYGNYGYGNYGKNLKKTKKGRRWLGIGGLVKWWNG